MRVATGPDPAAGQLVHPFAAEVAALGDAVDEVVVDGVEQPVEARQLALVERPAGGEHPRMRAAGDSAGGQARPLEQLAEHCLAAQHADRAGEGRGLGDDDVGRAGDVVAAGAGQRAHRHDDRLAGVPGQAHLAPDGVRGNRRAAR